MTVENDFTNEIKYVPAAPGHDVLLYMPETKTFEEHPVVAWGVLLGEEDFVCAQPITVLAWNINDDRAVRGPNGEVVWSDRFWPTVEQWLAEMKSNDGVPLDSADDDAPAKGDDQIALSDRPGVVLALNNFRDKFRSEQ